MNTPTGATGATGPGLPRPGVGVGVLVVHQGLLLLGKRRGSHGAGHWAAPGGRLEFGEALEDCARRELREETGLVARHLELGPYTNDVFEGKGEPGQVAQHFLTVYVVARSLQGTPRNLEPEKCEGWAWFGWDALPTPLFQPLQNLQRIGWRPGGL
jgi:8-oxo-dGTP diphosphatase